jgi:putative peptidoglycan lipid II flippase
VAWALLWYAAGLVGHCVVEIMARSFYALHDTRTPVILTSLAMGLNVAFSILFSSLFSRLGWPPHGGLALANSLATALEMIGLLALMRRRLHSLDGAQVLNGALKAALGALGMGIVLWVGMGLAGDQPAGLLAVGGMAAGGLVYGLAMLVLRVEETRALFDSLSARLRRARS